MQVLVPDSTTRERTDGEAHWLVPFLSAREHLVSNQSFGHSSRSTQNRVRLGRAGEAKAVYGVNPPRSV